MERKVCTKLIILFLTTLPSSQNHQKLTGFCPKSSVLSTLAPRLISVSQAACIPAIAARWRGVCFFCNLDLFEYLIFEYLFDSLLNIYCGQVERSLLLLQFRFVQILDATVIVDIFAISLQQLFFLKFKRAFCTLSVQNCQNRFWILFQ